MDLYEAVATIQAAASDWAQYRGENGHEDEAEEIDAASDVIDNFKRILRG